MNLMFICVVAFGILFLFVVIAGIIFNAKVGGSSQPAPWMRRLRQFQNETANAGWRIQLIPYDDTSKPMVMSMGGVLGVVPIVGAFGFLAGLAAATYDNDKYKILGLVVAVSSLVIAFVSAWLKERVVRQDWDFAPGHCVDRELQKVWIQQGVGGHWGWFWRIICEYEYLGIRYRVTPEVYWASFSSEDAALKFLEGRILPNGECTLRVNPKNLLQTDLIEQRSKLAY